MSSLAFACVETWEYPDIAAPSQSLVAETPPLAQPTATPAPSFTEDEVAERVQEALRAAEQHWSAQAEAREKQRKAQLTAALEAFAGERARYFKHLEKEVLELALAIARKILQREAELDPTLLGALVRIALDRMGAGPAVRVRMPPAEVPVLQKELVGMASRYDFELLPDETLRQGDCIVATDLGTANFGFEAQMKEIEQGLFDLLARRPGTP